MKLYKSFLAIAAILAVTTTYTIDRKFVLIVYSKNSKRNYTKTIDSFLTQTYQNFRMIWIDDASVDDTVNSMVHYHHDTSLEGRCKLIRVPKTAGLLYGLYKTIHTYVQDDEIVVLFQAGDSFSHINALKTLNQVYQPCSIILTYGNYRTLSGPVGPCSAYNIATLKERFIRKDEWRVGPPYTFYASLFKRLDLKTFLFYHSKNAMFRQGWDQMLRFPLLEKAAFRHKFISEVLYEKDEDLLVGVEVRKKQEFEIFRDSVYLRNAKQESSVNSSERFDRIAAKRPINISVCLFIDTMEYTCESALSKLAANTKVTLKDCIIIYRSGTKPTSEEQQKMQNYFETVTFLEFGYGQYLFYAEDQQLSLRQITQKLSGNYFFIISDKFVLQNEEDFHHYFEILYTTQTVGVLFGKFGRNYQIKSLYDISYWNDSLTMRVIPTADVRTIFPDVDSYYGFIVEYSYFAQMVQKVRYVPASFNAFSAVFESTLDLQRFALAVESTTT